MPARRTPRRATIVEVARRAGVSIKTVSRVTNDEPNVRPELREKVARAIAELGYRPMQAARGLAARRSRLLALVYDNPSAAYLVRVQQAASQCAQEHGMRLLYHPCDHRDPQLAAALVQLCAQLRLEGVILVPPVSLDANIVAALAAARIPCALLAPARAHAQAAAVLLDDKHAAHELTRHLLELGHRRIGFVRGHEDHEASRARLAGFRAAMRRSGIASDAALLADGDFTFDAGRRAGAQLLDRRVRPSAIIACNDDMAAGVIAAAHDRNVAIPAQLSVCGFDDTPLAAMLWPPLTTMHQPINELARAGTQLLLERIAGNLPAVAPSRLQYALVVRASTASPLRPAAPMAGA
jgi:LacI family transcriptional regulator